MTCSGATGGGTFHADLAKDFDLGIQKTIFLNFHLPSGRTEPEPNQSETRGTQSTTQEVQLARFLLVLLDDHRANTKFQKAVKSWLKVTAFQQILISISTASFEPNYTKLFQYQRFSMFRPCSHNADLLEKCWNSHMFSCRFLDATNDIF